MKRCTDLEQSKKLIEIGIDINTADLLYSGVHLGTDGKYYKSDDNWIMTPEYFIQLPHNCTGDIKNQLPAWSLTALYQILGSPVLGKADNYFVILYYADKDRNMKRIICEGESHVDACVDMILKLHDQELL